VCAVVVDELTCGVVVVFMAEPKNHSVKQGRDCNAQPTRILCGVRLCQWGGATIAHDPATGLNA
jgi:hypothetical protein